MRLQKTLVYADGTTGERADAEPCLVGTPLGCDHDVKVTRCRGLCWWHIFRARPTQRAPQGLTFEGLKKALPEPKRRGNLVQLDRLPQFSRTLISLNLVVVRSR